MMKNGKGNGEFVGRRPDYKGDGVAVWVDKTKEGEKCLKVKLAGHNTVVAFKPKDEKDEDA